MFADMDDHGDDLTADDPDRRAQPLGVDRPLGRSDALGVASVRVVGSARQSPWESVADADYRVSRLGRSRTRSCRFDS